jgi:hypothetical protein
MLRSKINLDALGVSASLACAIHCALLPLFFTSLPVLGFELINNIVFETVMIFAAFVIGAVSLYHGWKKHHHKKQPLIIFSVGIIFLFAKQIWHEYQFPFLIPAVGCIVFAHWLNYRFCKKANHCHANDCDHK